MVSHRQGRGGCRHRTAIRSRQSTRGASRPPFASSAALLAGRARPVQRLRRGGDPRVPGGRVVSSGASRLAPPRLAAWRAGGSTRCGCSNWSSSRGARITRADRPPHHRLSRRARPRGARGVPHLRARRCSPGRVPCRSTLRLRHGPDPHAGRRVRRLPPEAGLRRPDRRRHLLGDPIRGVLLRPGPRRPDRVRELLRRMGASDEHDRPRAADRPGPGRRVSYCGVGLASLRGRGRSSWASCCRSRRVRRCRT